MRLGVFRVYAEALPVMTFRLLVAPEFFK